LDKPENPTIVPSEGPDEGRPEDGQPENEADQARARSVQLGGGGGIKLGGFAAERLQFLRDVRDELRKVTWPTRKMVVTETIVVIVFVVFFTMLITGLDQVLAFTFNKLMFGK
jgi:preprotein translocase subunit SecE